MVYQGRAAGSVQKGIPRGRRWDGMAARGRSSGSASGGGTLMRILLVASDHDLICEPRPQEGEQSVEEELPGVSVEVELVLVIHWRLVPGGEEERLGFGWRTSCRS
jgi:hypothetical protein